MFERKQADMQLNEVGDDEVGRVVAVMSWFVQKSKQTLLSLRRWHSGSDSTQRIADPALFRPLTGPQPQSPHLR